MRALGIGSAFRSLVLCLTIWCAPSSVLAAPPPAAGLELGARVAAQASNQGLGALAGVHVDWRVVSVLALGVYGDLSPLYSASQLKCACGAPRERPARFGAFAELHLMPSGVADPFLRVGIGFLHTHRSAADSELGVGLDLRLDHFAIGPFVMWIVPFSGDQPKGWLALGGRFVLAL